MKKKMIVIFVLSLMLIWTSTGVIAKAYAAETELKINSAECLLMDYNTGKVLYTQNETKRRPIASMVKIMSLLLAFEKLEKGELSLEEEICVSEYATSMGGSQAFLDKNNNYKINELLKSIVVASANDSCVAIAEKIAGDTDNFVSMMNEKAKELGLKDTYFVNCTGLPAPNQYSCAADVAKMSRELYGHKIFFEYAKEWTYDFIHPSGRKTNLTNTNKLIRGYRECDGGKTGFTNEAKSCLSATAKRDDTRLIAVVMGAENSKERNKEIVRLFNYGFNNYSTKKVIDKDTVFAEIAVNNSTADKLQIAAQESFYSLIKKGEENNTKFEYALTKNFAPVQKGEVVGYIQVTENGTSVQKINLIALSDMKKIGYLNIVDKIIENW